jgi:hypothetical protein
MESARLWRSKRRKASASCTGSQPQIEGAIRVETKKVVKRTPAARSGARPGPKPDVLKIRGRWQDAVKQSLQKKKPAEGWPR